MAHPPAHRLPPLAIPRLHQPSTPLLQHLTPCTTPLHGTPTVHSPPSTAAPTLAAVHPLCWAACTPGGPYQAMPEVFTAPPHHPQPMQQCSNHLQCLTADITQAPKGLLNLDSAPARTVLPTTPALPPLTCATLPTTPSPPRRHSLAFTHQPLQCSTWPHCRLPEPCSMDPAPSARWLSIPQQLCSPSSPHTPHQPPPDQQWTCLPPQLRHALASPQWQPAITKVHVEHSQPGANPSTRALTPPLARVALLGLCAAKAVGPLHICTLVHTSRHVLGLQHWPTTAHIALQLPHCPTYCPCMLTPYHHPAASLASTPPPLPAHPA